MTHLVIGANGLIGKYVKAILEIKGENSYGTYYKHPEESLKKLDITNHKETLEDSIEWGEMIKENLDIITNTFKAYNNTLGDDYFT